MFLVVHDVNTSTREFNDDLKKLMIGLSFGKWVSIQIRISKIRNSSSVVNQGSRYIRLRFSIIIMPLKPFLKGTYNPGQNIWNDIEKSIKTGQDKESLISTFACFSSAIVKV